MSLPVSASELESAYNRLDPLIQKWIRDQGWDEIREIQARTILAVLDTDRDLLIAATTAAGKTEAAFLPILTAIKGRQKSGFSALYISPLKALINDQFRRLDELCERMEIPVVKWHGDAPQSEKRKALNRPDGVALITPESIEAMLTRRPADARRLLGSVDYIIVDEVHAFLQGPRGLHVASLLARIDAMSETPARRIGLSATIGDMGQAVAWLRPTDPSRVDLLQAKGDAPEILMQIRGYVEPPELDDPDRAEIDANSGGVALDIISDHIFKNLRGENNLVFGGSRRTVEAAADRLRRRSDRANVPNEFFPHHGSLSKQLREGIEERLKAGNLPTTAICTSTLELGIDIGTAKSVAQIGAPRSISSLRQRLGRTGRRRGVPSILRIYVREPAIGRKSGVLDQLHAPIVRAVAAIRLLLSGFVEPSTASPEIASTLVHQILSVVAERGGVRPAALHQLLCGPGPFESFNPGDFAVLLRHLGGVKLIEQAADSTLMLGGLGEQFVQSRNFFAVFESGEEWRLTSRGRTLGTLPISYPVHKDSLVVFAGHRWIVEGVDEKTKTLQVAPHVGGVVPKFERTDVEPAHDRLAAEMRATYLDHVEPPYLDLPAQSLLADGRSMFHDLNLDKRSLLEEDGHLHVFLWRGSRANAVFGAALAMAGLPAEPHDFGVTIPNTTIETGRIMLREIGTRDAPAAIDVAAFVENIRVGKFSEFIPDVLAKSQWAQQNAAVILEVPKMAWQACSSNSSPVKSAEMKKITSK